MKILVAGAIILLGVTARAAPVAAYPQWQFTSGSVRCNQCHYSPAGGGLLTSFGREAVGDELSTFGGNGALLHGLVRQPSNVAIGGDLRGAFLARGVQDPEGATVAVFPMQADLHARFLFGAGISFQGTVGYRGQVRSLDARVPMQNFQPVSTSRFVSREHFLLWQREVLGPYVRAGRFFAPFGLRLAEHVTYVRRDLGFNVLQETYNLSGGFVRDSSELHVTGFVHDFVRHVGSQEKGVAAYYERRVLDARAAWAAQARLAFSPGVTRMMVGGVGKLFLERARTMLLAELNAVQLVFDAAVVGSRRQVVGAVGATALPVRGLMLTLLAERNQLDIDVRQSGWSAATALVNWFPYAHFELQLMGRLQFPGGGDAAKTFLAQVHYFL